jgi:hypothetical protein
MYTGISYLTPFEQVHSDKEPSNKELSNKCIRAKSCRTSAFEQSYFEQKTKRPKIIGSSDWFLMVHFQDGTLISKPCNWGTVNSLVRQQTFQASFFFETVWHCWLFFSVKNTVDFFYRSHLLQIQKHNSAQPEYHYKNKSRHLPGGWLS